MTLDAIYRSLIQEMKVRVKTMKDQHIFLDNNRIKFMKIFMLYRFKRICIKLVI